MKNTMSSSVEELDLFGRIALERAEIMSKYPEVAGWKREGTSKLASQAIKADSKSLQARVLSVLRNTDATADECASRLGVSVLACRPRLSELVALGKIVETDTRRKNQSGKLASVWRAL